MNYCFTIRKDDLASIQKVSLTELVVLRVLRGTIQRVSLLVREVDDGWGGYRCAGWTLMDSPVFCSSDNQ